MEPSIDSIIEQFQMLPRHKQQSTYKNIRELIGRRIEKRIADLSSINDDDTLDENVLIQLEQYQSFLFDAYKHIMERHLICISDNFGFLNDSMNRLEEFYQISDQYSSKDFVDFLKDESTDIQIKIKELLSHDDSLKDTTFDVFNLYPLLSSSIIYNVHI